MKKLLWLGILSFALSGCALFRSKMPDYVRYNISQDDSREWTPGSMDHPKVWAENLHTMMLNSSRQPINHSHWAIDGAVFGVGEAAKEIDALEKDGAKFKVAVNASGKFSFQVMKPASVGSVAEGVLGALVPMPNQEDFVAMMLNNVGRGAKQLSIDCIPTIEALYFATVTEIQEIKSGKELSFDLPDGISRENYLELLDTLLLYYHNDYQEVVNYQGVLASSLAAIASLDSGNRGGIGNLYLVLGAALEDKERYEQQRKALEPYPPPDLPALRAKAAKLHTIAAGSARYKAWLQEPHALNKLSNFGSAVVDAFASLSEVYGMMGGIDVVGNVQEKIAQGLTVSSMLDIGLRLAPQGSKLESVLNAGKKVNEAAGKVSSAAADPGAAAASTLLLWATPEEIEKAKSRVIALQKPEH